MSTVYIRLPARGSGALRRAPLLERLLTQASPPRVADWRRDAFGVIAADGAAVPAIAATALHAAEGAVPGRWACIATPLHFVAGMSHLTLPEGGILQLTPAEAEALRADFNRVFGDVGVRLHVARAAVLICVFDRALAVATRDPEDVVGGDVFGFQPTGIDAAQLKRLMSEMEMWLFEHAVNRWRAAQELLPVTGLWLWGGGALLAAMPVVQGWTAGRDPLFAAFGDAEGLPPESAPGVLVCADRPGSVGWPDVETRWLAPLVAALRSGRIERLEFSVAARGISVARGRTWRIWRRARPWWESFELEGSESNGMQ